MKTTIRTKENISTLAITYFDEIGESLKEISDGGVYFAMSPFETQHKRLYIIGDFIYNHRITVKAEVDSLDDYSVKLSLGLSTPDFESNVGSITMETSSSSFINALPLDISITSNRITEKNTSVKFTISAESL